jgi:hypothetical protein
MAMHRRRFLIPTWTVLALWVPGQAAAEPARPPAELRSCVAGSPGLAMAVTAERAMLDPADTKRLQLAAQQRYALYRRGGTAPAHALLLRRDRHWLYVMLEQDATGPCFSAVFAAERFDFTRDWIARYRPQPADAPD